MSDAQLTDQVKALLTEIKGLKLEVKKLSAKSADPEEDHVAVIAAAVAAYESEAYAPKLYIQKINRAAGTRLAWAAAGTNEAIDVRRI